MGYHVVIPAAGSGRRMGAKQNKVLIELLGKPLIAYTLQVFEDDGDCEGIILAIKADEKNQFQAIAHKYGFKKIRGFIEGGSERQDSVRLGLMHISGDGVVLIHDGARPFVSHKTIRSLVKAAEDFGAAIPAVPVKDTIKRVKDDFIKETLNREYLWAAQTPQAFRLPIIMDAHKKAQDLGYMATDDAALVEWMGMAVKIVHGDYRNIKITTPEDLLVAQHIMT
jgi:2-C-methyl-D-erythritol 4-phosphate cytidylyltransferase